MSNSATVIDLSTVRAAQNRAEEEARIADATRGHWQGAKYSRDLSIVDIAKAVRCDIKAAVKSAELPAGLKASVRVSKYSMGQSLTVTIRCAPFAIVSREHVAWALENPDTSFSLGPDYYTEQAKSVVSELERIVADYNYDRSDVLSDYFCVNFYERVLFDGNAEQADRDAVAAEIVGPPKPILTVVACAPAEQPSPTVPAPSTPDWARF